MSTPRVRKATVVQITSDPCPRGCNSGPGTATHLMSDHVEEKVRHCNKCACVVQDVSDPRTGS